MMKRNWTSNRGRMNGSQLRRALAVLLLSAMLWNDLALLLQPLAPDMGATNAVHAEPIAAELADVDAPQAVQPWLPLDETFVRRTVGFDGEQSLFVSSTPLNYRDTHGAWQPIDARFETLTGGFANERNVLRIRVRADQAVAAAQVGSDQIVWQPTTLHADSALLATATPATRAAAYGDIVRLAGGWTRPGLSDEFVAGPGRLEHNVLFAASPITTTAATTLTLSALLRLPTGLQLVVQGKPQQTAFATDGAVELRDTAGQTQLLLSPAYIFEQRRPEQAVTARYHFEPVDAVTWRVAMSTPAAWWQAPERTYPVVWDPAFAVVGNMQVTEIAGPAVPGLPLVCHLYDATKSAGVGVNGTCGERRLLVKFNGLSSALFPPGFTIARAQLVMAPNGGLERVLTNGARAVPDTWVDVFAATNANTQWPGPTTGTRLCSSQHLILLNGVYGQPINETCDIQVGNNGVVRDWISGGPNHGLLLQPATNCGWAGCGFVTLPQAGRWVAQPTNRIDEPRMVGAGVGLVIHYRGPTLGVNTPYRHTIAPAQDGAPFARTDHGYQLPATAGEWTAVGVKALRDRIYLNDASVLSGSFGYAQWSQYIGNPPVQGAPPEPETFAYPFPISVVSPNCLGSLCQVQSLGAGDADSTNYVLVKGNVSDKEVRIGAVQPDDELDGYAVEVAPSTPIPTIPADYATAAYVTGVTFSHEFSISTDHVVSVLDLPLLKDTRARITLDWEIPGMNYPTASVQGRLFTPVSNGDGFAKTGSRHDFTEVKPLDYPVPRSGTYGLVLELPGDATPVNANLRDPGSFEGVGTPAQRVINVTLTVTVCPRHMEPSDKGCDDGRTPDFSQGLNWIAVGDYRVYSPAGFVCNPDKFAPNPKFPTCNGTTIKYDEDCPDEWCAVRTDADGRRYFATVTWQTDTTRVLVLVGNEDDIAGKYLLSANYNRATLRSNAAALLRAGGTPGGVLSDDPRLSLWVRNQLYKLGSREALEASCDTTRCGALPLTPGDGGTLVNVEIHLRPDQVGPHAHYAATLDRPLQTEDGIEYQSFQLQWDVRAEGYRGREESPNGDAPLNVGVARIGTPVNAARIAGLKYYFGNQWDAYYNPSPTAGYFDRFRNDDGHIKQDPKLGGAWGEAVYIILPFGEGAAGSAALAVCQGYCGDVRAADDTWAKPNRAWRMPDVNINQLPPPEGVVAAGQDAADVSFSFKTMGARVSIEETACPGSTDDRPVQVIHGETSLAMPGLGGAGGGAAAEFYLCEASLRSVKLSFTPPLPGIPVAYPPVMYVTLIQGIVDIYPDFAEITLNIGFYVGAVVPKLITGVGSVIIDTRGRFDLTMNGRVMGIADTSGGIWVAWQQLDIGAAMNSTVPNADEWILRGDMSAHMWLGQGWQHRYNWLPDDDQLHFTAGYGTRARLPVKVGALVNKFPLVVPPIGFTLEDEMQFAFGQFCAGDDCNQFKTGMKAKRKIMGYDAGIYIDLDCTSKHPEVLVGALIAPPLILACAKFIIASDAHVLLDQYPAVGALTFQAAGATAQAAPLQLGNQSGVEAVNRRTVSDPTAATVEESLPEVVAQQTSGFLVAFGWARGAPTVTLIRPDGMEITPDNAVGVGMEVTRGDNQVILGASDPMPGVWKVRIDDATPTDDYHLAYFANKSTPSLQFIQPADTVTRTDANPTYRIEWTPPPHADKLRLSLFYTGVDATPINEGQQVGGVIVQHLDPSVGFFDWDLGALHSGSYRITARLEDKAGGAVSALGTDQFVGVTEAGAPGTLVYTDNQPPPPLDPTQIEVTPADGGVLLCWPVPSTLDLAEYRLDYLVRDPIGGRVLAERLPADVRFEPDGSARQCVRLVGLINGKSEVEFDSDPDHGIRVRDASGNYSAPAKPANFRTSAEGVGPAPARFVISGTVNAGNPVLNWSPETGVRWELFYGQEFPASTLLPQAGASQGASPLALDGNSFNGAVTVTGLPRGYWYSFAARAFGSADPYAPPGPLSNHVWLLVSDGVDANGDGCADDWQAAHGVTDTSTDPDGDALATRDECNRGTRPDLPDTDGDGWWDGEEVAYATDPLDPLSFPIITPDNGLEPLPRLAVAPEQLTFYAFEQGPNPAEQRVAIDNLGGGALQPTAQADQPWIRAQVTDAGLALAVDKTGLGAGVHRGVVTLNGGAGVLSSPALIDVELQLLAEVGDGPAPTRHRIFLPWAQRQ